jgi:hypothetical protein
MLQSQGKAAFLEGSAPLAPIMRGAEIHRQWEDGGKLASARLIFDTAAMAALMPGS